MANENKLWKSEATRPVMEGNVQYHIRCGEGDIEKYCLLPGDPNRCNVIAETWDKARLVADYREHRTFSGEIGGVKITTCSTGAGSGSASSAERFKSLLTAEMLLFIPVQCAMMEQVICTLTRLILQQQIIWLQRLW